MSSALKDFAAKMTTKVYFYVPGKYWPNPIPDVYDTRWEGFGEGYHNWVLQTYLLLRGQGVITELTNDVKGKPGIIISHRAMLNSEFCPAPDQLLVCIQADWGRHPYAQAHICQNKAQTTGEGRRAFYQLFWPANTYFVHHWPQPGILERNPEREPALNCISYYGLDYNLAPELRSENWHTFLSELGIDWRIVDNMSEWSDFRETDAVLFCRDFKGTPYYNKPATKLYNTWLAQCLPICTPESAFLQECKPGDPEAVIIESYEELKECIFKLKQDPTDFSTRLDLLSEKSKQYTYASIAREWEEIFQHLESDYRKFCHNPARRSLFMATRTVSKLLLRAIGKLDP